MLYIYIEMEMFRFERHKQYTVINQVIKNYKVHHVRKYRPNFLYDKKLIFGTELDNICVLLYF